MVYHVAINFLFHFQNIIYYEIGPYISNDSIFMFDSIVIQNAQLTKDLGNIPVEPDLKFEKHISDIINRSNQRSALMFRSFLSHNQNNLLRAYKTCSTLDGIYASSIWAPSLITQIMALQATQKRFTKRLPNLSILTYSDRLTTLKLQSLEHRRLITDLILCYKIIHKNTSISFSDFFKFPYKTSPRSHSLHFSIPKLKSNTHKSSFAYIIESCQHGTPCRKTL